MPTNASLLLFEKEESFIVQINNTPSENLPLNDLINSCERIGIEVSSGTGKMTIKVTYKDAATAKEDLPTFLHNGGAFSIWKIDLSDTNIESMDCELYNP